MRILFVFAAVALAGAGIFYRADSARSARLQAAAIVASDTAGADTAAAINSLKNYSAAHMGASVNFTLQGSYNRAAAAAQATAAAPAGSNAQIYADAQRACSGKTDSITQAKCNAAYLSSHLSAPPAPTPTPAPAPKLADYQYSFASPWWTPDLAGALLLGAAVSILAAVVTRRRRR